MRVKLECANLTHKNSNYAIFGAALRRIKLHIPLSSSTRVAWLLVINNSGSFQIDLTMSKKNAVI